MQAVFSCRAHLGLGAILALASIAGATCDPAFNSVSISAATSPDGHVMASHGNDGLIRIGQFDDSKSAWTGWLNLSRTSDQGGYSDPWVQSYIPSTGSYVYAIKGDSLIQWRVGSLSSQFGVTRSALSGATGISGRPASARLSSTVKTAVAANFNGTIMIRANTSGAWGSWISLSGLSNAQGSPWMTQLPSYGVNLYVRTSDQKIKQNYWNGTTWSGWGEVVSSGVNSDPASTYDASTGTHYLYFLNTSNIAAKWTFTYYWASTTLPNFPGKKSFTAVMANEETESLLYGLDYQGNAYQGESGLEVNCFIPYSTNY